MKTREQKIEALAEKYLSEHSSNDGTSLSVDPYDVFKAGYEARDEELLAMEFDESVVCRAAWPKNLEIEIDKSGFTRGARWQLEQFMNILKQK